MRKEIGLSVDNEKAGNRNDLRLSCVKLWELYIT